MDTPPFPPDLEPPILGQWQSSWDPQRRKNNGKYIPPFRRVATHGPTPFLPRSLPLLYTPYMRGVYICSRIHHSCRVNNRQSRRQLPYFTWSMPLAPIKSPRSEGPIAGHSSSGPKMAYIFPHSGGGPHAQTPPPCPPELEPPLNPTYACGGHPRP